MSSTSDIQSEVIQIETHVLNSNNKVESIMKKSEVNIKGLKDETARHYLRTFKKIEKLNEKINKSFDPVENSDSNAELAALQTRLKDLTSLETLISSYTKAKDLNGKQLTEINELSILLQISDHKPAQPERGPKKIKAPPQQPRKPYFTYLSRDGIEIRVGRGAADNDELSCNPLYRDSDNWWLHAAGYAGSHVVIRSDDDQLLTNSKNTIIDAAAFAALNSKANQQTSGKVPVTLTRCRNVSKPRNAKPGLVMINGDVTTIKVDLKVDGKRIEELKKID
jgi:predicted ribosome quality control (RQC) complex YloA/Tae2 family protein